MAAVLATGSWVTNIKSLATMSGGDSAGRLSTGVARLTVESGSSFGCKVLNLSLGGAAVEVEVRPPIGQKVSLGRTEGRVVRHTRNGLAIEFTPRV